MTNKYLQALEKRAKQEESSSQRTVLRPHAQAALDKLDKTNGVLLHHSTGSGKTLTFLTAIEKALEKDKSGRAFLAAPASLVSNIDKEIEKHHLNIDRSRLDVMSYEKAVNRSEELKKNKYAIAVLDEAQKVRNAETKRTKQIGEIVSGANQRLLATATANYNHPADLAPILNMVHGGKVLPENKSEFEAKFLKMQKKPLSLAGRIMGHKAEEEQVLKDDKELGKLFKEHVHYYDSSEDASVKDKFPETKETKVEVDMSPEQKKMYSFMEGQLPFWIKMKVRNGMPLDKQEKAELNSFSSGVRQVSNSYRHLSSTPDKVSYTPKIEKAVGSLKDRMAKDKNFRGVVYSNYLDAGVKEYARKLKQEGVSHTVFSGELSKKEKDRAVKDYNEGKTKVLLISSSGAEGLDLKGTKLTQVMDPHFNPSKIKQVIGRGSRYESHAHLPKEEQTHEVEHYLTTFPKNFMGKAPMSIDKYLSENSGDKQKVFDQIKDVMKKSN